MTNLGQAEITIKLTDDKILVYHSEGPLLFEKKATPKSWDEIWEAIRN